MANSRSWLDNAAFFVGVDLFGDFLVEVTFFSGVVCFVAFSGDASFAGVVAFTFFFDEPFFDGVVALEGDVFFATLPVCT